MRALCLRFSLVLLATVPTAPAAGHFVFIQTVPVPSGSAVHAGFGEPGRWDTKLARNIEPTSYAVRTEDGKEAEVRLRFNDRAMCYVGVAPHRGPAAILGVCEYGVVQKGKAKPFLLTYYAKRYAGGPSTWEKVDGSQRLRVEAQARYDGRTIALTVRADGKGLANAEINTWGPGGASKLKADADGKASWPAEGPGEYALWVSRVSDRAGDLNGKKYAEAREVATLTFSLPAPNAKPEALKADPSAAKSLGLALRAQELWDGKFPGFHASITAGYDGGVKRGAIEVGADGQVKLTPERAEDWPRPLTEELVRRVESMAWHRAARHVGRPGSTGGMAPAGSVVSVASVGQEEGASKGAELAVIGDPFASRFWIKDGQLRAARRVLGDRRQAISVLASEKTKRGASVPTLITTSLWDLNGRLQSSEGERREWVEVGGYTLPAKIDLTRAETAHTARQREGADPGWTSLTLTFTNHQLGSRPPAAAKGVTSYPGFRGDGTGRSAAKRLPLEWSPKTLAWQAKLPGYGQSSPVVHGGRVYVTAIEGPNKEKNLALAFDAASGKPLWRKELPATQKVKASFAVSRGAPTPAVDDAALYTFFESGELAALSHKDGAQLWLRSLVKDYGELKNNHGISPSLAQTADTLFVLIDHQGPSYLLAVNKKTGENRWKVDRKSRVSWSSPVVVGEKGQERLVVSSAGSVDVYECSTGKRLSTYTDVGNNSVPSAVVQGDRVVVGASDPPRNADRELTLKSCCCLTLGADGKLSEKPVWQSKKAAASFASPLIHQGHVYYVNSVGVVYCLDLKTGEERYSQRLPGSCWASPVAAGDRVYFFGKDGVTTVVKAGPKYVRLASNRLWDGPDSEAAREKPADGKKDTPQGTPPQFSGPIVYGAAVVDGAIFLRTGTDLFAVRAK